MDILKIHSRKMNLTRGINLRKIAELMPGSSGAEVKVLYFAKDQQSPYSETDNDNIKSLKTIVERIFSNVNPRCEKYMFVNEG